MAPALALRQLLWGCFLGLGLGLGWTLLAPLPRLRDRSFPLLLLLALAYLDFSLSAGDLRPAGILSLGGGFFLWRWLLQPVFSPIIFRFLKLISRLWGAFLLPAKKFLIFLKILFAYPGK